MRNIIEQWDLTFTASGGTFRFMHLIPKLKRIAEKYGFSCNTKTVFNIIVFKIIDFTFTGHCTEKYANKFKKEIAEYCYQYT